MAVHNSPELARRVRELEQAVSSQQAEIHRLMSLLEDERPPSIQSPATPALAPPKGAAPNAVATVPKAQAKASRGARGLQTRRDLLRIGGVAAGAAGLAAAGLARPQEAEASFTWTGGSINTADHVTQIDAGASFPDQALLLLNADANANTGNIRGLKAYGSGNSAGVDGENSLSGGTGVIGSGAAAGVIGAASTDSGFGVGGGGHNNNINPATFPAGIGVVGVGGTPAGAPGVVGYGGLSDGPGVIGNGRGANGAGVIATGGTGSGAPLRLVSTGGAGTPAGPSIKGDIWIDSNATLYVCTTAGTPGSWTRVTGVPAAGTGGAVNYLAQPVRVIDTRASSQVGPFTGPLPKNTISEMGPFTGSPGNLPANIRGLIGNISAIGMSDQGFVTMFPGGSSVPSTATINFGPQVYAWANAFSVAVGTGGHAGKVSVFVSDNVPVDVAIDITGYVM